MTTSARGRVIGIGIAAVTALVLSSCASNDASAPKTSSAASDTAPASTTAATDSSASTAPSSPAGSSTSTGGTVPKGEPDVNGDGKVVIGVLSPGDINDNGYYESFVSSAETYAKARHWTVIKRGNVPANDALNAARALCRLKVDMVALGAGELANAIPASEEAVCANTAWYVPSSANIKQAPKIVLSTDDPNQDLLAAGYAAGLLMKANNQTKAGFVTGIKADFSVLGAKAFKAGIKEIVPNASLITSYTGDFNDSAKAKEATQAQISQGAKVIYPYLGGATDASAILAQQNNVLTLTPGTDRCSSTSPKFAISVIFDPGQYFLAALQAFNAGTLAMGVEKVWQMGKDPFPTVKMCQGTAAQKAQLADFIKKIGDGTIDPKAEVAKLGG